MYTNIDEFFFKTCTNRCCATHQLICIKRTGSSFEFVLGNNIYKIINSFQTIVTKICVQIVHRKKYIEKIYKHKPSFVCALCERKRR